MTAAVPDPGPVYLLEYVTGPYGRAGVEAGQ